MGRVAVIQMAEGPIRFERGGEPKAREGLIEQRKRLDCRSGAGGTPMDARRRHVNVKMHQADIATRLDNTRGGIDHSEESSMRCILCWP